MLESDPFTRVQHVHHQPQPSPAFQAYWGVSQSQPIQHHKGSIWHFSEEEKKHLALATGAFTLALGLMMANGIFGLMNSNLPTWLLTLGLMMPVMLIAVGPAFLLHEIGHKVVAKHYGCWAEFRADPKGLRTGIFIAGLLGIVFMAPGAVMVAGLVTRKQNGHIAIAGPMVNLGLFLIGIPLGALVLALTGVSNPSQELLSSGGVNLEYMIWLGVRFWLTANLVLGMFNMLPFGPLDGLKVKSWSEPAFWAMTLVFAVPLFAWWFLGMWNPMVLVSSLAAAMG